MIRFSNDRYDVTKCVRIVNPRQCAMYMKHGVMPIDFYLGREDTLVYVFVQEETKDVYTKWVNHELN